MSLPLVGRRCELAKIGRCLHEAAGGRGSLVLLSGEAGTGKTALAEAAAAEAEEFRVAVGRCQGPGETPPFGPWLEASLLRTPGADAEKAVADQVARAGRPVLLILEDLHWADPASCRLLARVAEWISSVPVVVVATFGNDELHRKHPLAGYLPGLRQVCAEYLQLRPFGPDELAALAARAGGVSSWLAGANALSPLLATEQLADQTGVGPCTTARELFASRLSRLDPQAREMVQAAAVLGLRFGRRLLAAMTGLPASQVLADLRPAADFRLIQPAGNGCYEFLHAAAREAALNSLILPQRRRMHVQAADALLCLSAGSTFTIGRHLHLGGNPRAADYLMVAADSARQAGALADAEQLYEQALEWLPERGPRRLCCLLKLCLTLRASGQAERARLCFEEANYSHTKG